MKLLKLVKSDLSIVRGREAIYERLVSIYGETKGNDLFNFYLLILMEGQKIIKSRISKPTYYRKLKLLREANVDLVQSDVEVKFNECGIVDFDPFSYPKVV